jgi:hypothetical protein
MPPDTTRDLRGKIALTYDNTGLTDGMGAQLQRIYGIYSVSRLIGSSYVHSPVARVDYQGLSSLEDNAYDPGFVDDLNRTFLIDSDISSVENFREVRLRDISMATIDELVTTFHRDSAGGKPLLVRLLFPYGISDHFPDCYEICKELSPFVAPAPIGRPFRVAVHVRRGDLFAVQSHRMLPNSYYLRVAHAVARGLEEQQFGYQIELWTEVPQGRLEIGADHLGQGNAPLVVTPEMCRLDEFSELPNLVMCINGSPIECMRQLATADVLVMSRSSFSYVAGILNKNGIALYHPFWHGAPSSWIAVGPDGDFDEVRFAEAVKAL